MKMKRVLAFLTLLICSAMALEPNYTLPPITYMTADMLRQEVRQRGVRLMELKGVPDGDSTLICTNWFCPTSIVVGVARYDVTTNWWGDALEFDVVSSNNPAVKVAEGKVYVLANGLEARLDAFSDMSCTSMLLSQYAQGVEIRPIDPATNMMFLTSTGGHVQSWRRLVYKNIFIRYSVTGAGVDSPATNALAFTAALINAGLPEEDRIPVPPHE